ncbi:MAG: hypothetical protein IJX86_12310 [Lachnospiraceae bacterium]|nr:hypothetical protein [Lachnospiraceae bacterium]
MAEIVLRGNNEFEYTYSASKQSEIDRIRKKYLPKEEDKMETLRRLDKNAEKPGTIIALVIGIIGALIMGVGMCCTMVWADTLFVPGILIGILGIAILSIAYPVYKKVTGKRRAKVAEQILSLTEELSI